MNNIKETILINIKKISKRKTKFPTHYNTIIILHINDTDFREKSQVSSCREMHHILPWHATVKHTCTRGCAIVSKKTPDFLDSTRQVLGFLTLGDFSLFECWHISWVFYLMIWCTFLHSCQEKNLHNLNKIKCKSLDFSKLLFCFQILVNKYLNLQGPSIRLS